VARQIPKRGSRYAAVPIDWRTQPRVEPQRPATEWVAR
jgi:hypothetical protein